MLLDQWSRTFQDMRIRDLMTTDLITVGPEMSLKEAARRMLMAGVSGLPVTQEGALVGIITEADFVSAEAERGDRKRAGLLRLFVRENGVPSYERTVGDVMTREIRVIGPDAEHVEAARLMHDHRVKRLPVVEDDRLVGLISRTDVIRSFVRPDREIVDEIRESVMRKVMWVDPKRVAVNSEDGNVTLAGNLETRSDVELLEELAKRVDGVASVRNYLSYEVDNTKLEMTVPPPIPRPTGNW